MTYYIAFDNNILPLGLEFVTECDSNLYGSMSPHMALEFSSLKKAKKWVKDNIPSTDETPSHIKFLKKVELNPLIEKWDLWLETAIYRPISRLNHGMNVKYDPTKHSQEDVLNWWFELYEKDLEDQVHTSVWRTWNNAFYGDSTFKHITGMNSYYDEDDYSDIVSTVQMSVNPNSSYQTFKEEFELVKNKITYKADGYKIISIFDDGLSSADSYIFCFNDSHYGIQGTRYQEFGEFDFESTNLKDIFKYWKQELPYSV